MSEGRPARIVILGGGTAGWMAANLFRHAWEHDGTAITLIESSEIGIIGVGEGSTPQLKAFFDRLGIAEADWMPRCNATYKAGIQFDGWSQRSGFESYFHPFPTAVDGFTAPQFIYNTRARRTGRDVWAHPDRFFLATALAAQRKAPLAPANFPFRTGYGYHFDATLVGAYLRDIAVARGVCHVDARIAAVDVTADGDVAALIGENGERFDGDLFVDASGFRAMIIGGALAEPFLPFADNLFNDRAVVVPTAAPMSGPEVATRATALSAGWAWHIPLTSRSGNGYVYSSRHIDDAAAAAELRAHLGLATDTEVRHLKMRVGRHDRSWLRNCLAIGLAQGFVEPLEATALHVVLATVETYIDAVDEGISRDTFNAAVARRIEGIRDYLVCHYRTAGRRDTPYWRDATSVSALSDSLKAIISCWYTGGDLAAELAAQDIEDIYPSQSWHCLLAGYGNFPEDTQLRPPGNDIDVFDMAAVDRFVAGCAMNFPLHAEALDTLQAGVTPLRASHG